MKKQEYDQVQSYEQVLGAVRRTMTHEAHDFVDDEFMLVPVAANDNEGPWPHLPFPDGWTASC